VGLLGEGPDRLLMAVPLREDPGPLLLAALRFVRPGSPFAVFHEDPVVLGRALVAAERLGMATRVGLCDLFSRKVQVLPSRTHPTMSMDSASGFVAHGLCLLSPYSLALPSVQELYAERERHVEHNRNPAAPLHTRPSTAPVPLPE